MSKKAKSKKKNMNAEDIIGYTGPLTVPKSKEGVALVSVNVNIDSVVTSTAGGVSVLVYGSNDADLLASDDFLAYAGIYGEYRVLGFSAHFKPSNKYFNTGAGPAPQRPGYVVIDRSSATALGGRNEACQFSDALFVCLNENWTKVVKMNSIEESEFQPTSGGSSTYWIKFYFNGLANSTEYGYVHRKYLIQFKNRK